MDHLLAAKLTRSHTALRAILTLSVVLAALFLSTSAKASSPGQVNVLRNATSAFDSYTVNATTAQQQWIREHYWRMRGYAPYFDRALKWAPSTDFYRDLYAIYPDESTLLSQHPNWVLKDGGGQRLYIPWACNGSACTQYAADIGNPAFRQFWIDEAKGDIAKGYKGIFIDDVNLEMKVGNASGDFTRPTDPRTGQAMSDADWRRYMAEFSEEIRAQIPSAFIVHNTAWWMDQNDPYVRREIAASDALELERGFNDSGLTGGTGKYGLRTLLSHIDWLHSRGKSVILEPRLSTSSQREYELAAYYLVSNGSDSICSDYQTNPDSWWSGWETDLGASQGGRYEWRGLLRRDFENGFVLVNPPGAGSTSVSLEGSFGTLGGGTVDSANLSERQGKVFVGSVTPPPSEPVAPSEPAPPEVVTPPSEPAPIQTEPPSDPIDSGSTVEVSGEVKVEESTKVTLTVQRHDHKRWRPTRNAKIRTKRSGKFRRRFRGLGVGHYRVVARSVRHPRQRAIVRNKRFDVK